MKKHFRITFLVLVVLFTVPAVSFGQIYTIPFSGTGTCPTQGNTPTVSANATGTSFTRSTVTCTTAADVFNSTTLNNTASINDASYIEFSVTANANAQLNVTSLSFFRQASNSAPNQLEVRYSTNNFTTSTSWGAAPTTPTSGSVTTWDFADFKVPPSTTLTFRFYPYGTQRADLGAGTANGSVGTFRVDDVTLNGTSPLPVGFVSFTGKSSKNEVSLNWVTAWEEKNQGFEVQKSANAQSFETIGFVTGKSTTPEQSAYSFTDASVMAGQLYYYRLKQKDEEGSFAFSKIIGVRAVAGEQDAELAVFPNPSRGSFTLSGQDADKVNIRLFNPAGIEIPISTTATENQKALDIWTKTVLTPGLYFLNVNAADGTTRKALKVMVN